ncbi:hypothetical protein DID78_04945 [Candidatus Marinamargulisbacteria bacterium SCGC AG-343-D04]|nr:hypothetical protein DID78_04945 [Candidatus Marinamargulisbacteria bacterium SCGC AG-343-D04]
MDNLIARAGDFRASVSKTTSSCSGRHVSPRNHVRNLVFAVAALAASSPAAKALGCSSGELRDEHGFASTTSTQKSRYNSISIEDAQPGDRLKCNRDAYVDLGNARTYLDVKQLVGGRLEVSWRVDGYGYGKVNSFDAIVWKDGKPITKVISGSLEEFKFNFYADGAVMQVAGGPPFIAKWDTVESYGHSLGLSRPPWDRPVNCELSGRSNGNRNVTICTNLHVDGGQFYSLTDIKSLKLTPKPTSRPNPTPTPSQISTPNPMIRSTNVATSTSGPIFTATSGLISTSISGYDDRGILEDLYSEDTGEKAPGSIVTTALVDTDVTSGVDLVDDAQVSDVEDESLKGLFVFLYVLLGVASVFGLAVVAFGLRPSRGRVAPLGDEFASLDDLSRGSVAEEGGVIVGEVGLDLSVIDGREGVVVETNIDQVALARSPFVPTASEPDVIPADGWVGNVDSGSEADVESLGGDDLVVESDLGAVAVSGLGADSRRSQDDGGALASGVLFGLGCVYPDKGSCSDPVEIRVVHVRPAGLGVAVEGINLVEGNVRHIKVESFRVIR